MKKIMSLILGLSLVTGNIAFTQEKMTAKKTGRVTKGTKGTKSTKKRQYKITTSNSR